MAQRIIPGGRTAQEKISKSTTLQETGLIALQTFQVRNGFCYSSGYMALYDCIFSSEWLISFLFLIIL